MAASGKRSYFIRDTETLLEVGGSPQGIRNLPPKLQEMFGDIELQLLSGKRFYGQINTSDTGEDLTEGGRETIKDSVVVSIKEKGKTRKVALVKLKEGVPSYLIHGEREDKREPIGVPDPSVGTFYIALWKDIYYKGKLESAIVALELDH